MGGPMMHVERQRWSRSVWVVLSLLATLGGPRAWAFSTGITSNNFLPTASQGCNNCHSGGTAPTVMLSGPTSVAPNSTNTYTLQINNPPAQLFGGLNVSAPDGTFAAGGADTHTLLNFSSSRLELTHTAPKAAVSGVTTFSFQWTAPASFTSVTLTGWGNAVNLSGDPSGDKAASNTLTVFSNAPTDTPTVTPTATPTATATPPMHDSVVLPVLPINVAIPKSLAPPPKVVKVHVKVRNADAASETLGDPIQLMAESVDCPLGVTVGTPNFAPMNMPPSDTVQVPGGKTKTATTLVTIHAADFVTFNHKAPNRCTLRFTATTQVGGNSDPTANNIVTAELNVIDKTDPESASAPPPHETVAKSIAPLTVTVAKTAASPVIKFVHPVVINADILPTPDAGDAIGLTVDPFAVGCPWLSVGTIDIDKPTPGDQSTVTVKGGKSATAKVQVLVFPGAVVTTNPKSPARCTTTIHATGPTDPDPESSNNATTLTVDVVDKHDVP